MSRANTCASGRKSSVSNPRSRYSACPADHPPDEQQVPVGDRRALRDPGGAGRVDERREVVGAELLATADALGFGRARSEREERAPLELAVVRIDRAVEHDHVAQPRQVGSGLAELVPLRRVLDERHLGLGVAHDVRAVGGEVRRVDADRDPAAAHDPEVAHDPLETRAAQDAHAVPTAYAEGDQAPGDTAHGIERLGPRPLDPAAVLLEPVREARRPRRDRVLEHPEEGGGLHTFVPT
jgi:hypothetical protein